MKELYDALYDAIEKSGIDLAKAKEGFIIEEIAPYFNDEKLIQKLNVRLIEVGDIKKYFNQKICKALQWGVDQANPEYDKFIEEMKEIFKDDFCVEDVEK